MLKFFEIERTFHDTTVRLYVEPLKRSAELTITYERRIVGAQTLGADHTARNLAVNNGSTCASQAKPTRSCPAIWAKRAISSKQWNGAANTAYSFKPLDRQLMAAGSMSTAIGGRSCRYEGNRRYENPISHHCTRHCLSRPRMGR